jgi:alpha-galactosidase
MINKKCLLALAVGLLTAGQLRADSVWLSSLTLSNIVQDWGTPQVDKSITGKPISIAGQKFEHGLGTHANSTVWIDLHRAATRFTAYVGVDDDAGSDTASISYRVVADGKTVFRTGKMRPGQAAKKVDVDVSGVKSLLLFARAGTENISFDHADWAEAKIDFKGQRPATVGRQPEKTFILTPRPPRAPRINGARIFGVRPGRPFLYAIPATGDRPMTFGVDDLPVGLEVDPQTGHITGKLAQAGEYVVTFTAANSRGRAERKFKIVCGDTLALTPTMGWNSWYVWESHVTDAIMRAAADAMVSSGLINHGYQYVDIDDCWAVKPGSTDPSRGGQPRDAQGRVNPNACFPDMKAMTDYIHAKGLKAGIYTSPGPTTCAGHVGAWQHEAQDAQLFAAWGFDLLKYDWCSYSSVVSDRSLPALQKPYRLMGDLLKQQDRDIVLNMCQYGMGNVWTWGKDVGGHSWRTGGDLGGNFNAIPAALYYDSFDIYTQNDLYKYGGPGGWNDPDYLLLGYLSNWGGKTVMTPLTPNEQYTHVSLWAMVAAPLIFSGDMTRLDDFTLNLLCNDEVIDIDQDPLGKPGRRVAVDGEKEVWLRELEDGSAAIGLFNRDEAATTIEVDWAKIGLAPRQVVRDVWRQKDLGISKKKYKARVERHGVVLLRVRPDAAAENPNS